MDRRVVITGMGVCAPNGITLREFGDSLYNGISGIDFFDELKELKFSCQIGGKPKIPQDYLDVYFSNVQQKGLLEGGLVYGVIAGVDAWKDAGLEVSETNEVDWETGICFGTGMLGADKFREAIYKVDDGAVRRLGSTTVVQTMASGISAYLGGMLGCGNQVTTNSSACTTGTESILMAYDRIKNGNATRMLAGSCSDAGPYIWGGFDAMRILPSKYNDAPQKASRPMSATASGFVPGSGAGAVVLESLESAKERGAHIYAEVLGGSVNSGGQRNGGTITAPNNEGVQRCIQQALKNSKVLAEEIDAINGHLTATTKDATEIENWTKALGLSKEKFPYINTFKGTLGHCLAAAGSIECVGTVLQFTKNAIFKNVNCEDIHPDILTSIYASSIVKESISLSPNIIMKASFGFGDVNACLIFKKYTN